MSSPDENLDTIPLDEKYYQADQALMRDYLAFSADIMRASLTGIALVGVLVIFFADHLEKVRLALYLTVALLLAGVGLTLGQRWWALAAFAHHLAALKCGLSAGRRGEAAIWNAARNHKERAARLCLILACVTLFAAALILGGAFLSLLYPLGN